MSWSKLVFIAVLASAGILGIVVFMTPKPIDDPKLVAELKSQIDREIRNSEKPTVEPATIQLADTPREISDSQLQERLIQIADEAVRNQPKNPAAMHVAALCYSELKQTTVAADLWKRCLDLEPKEPGPYVAYTDLLLRLGRPDEAKEILDAHGTLLESWPPAAQVRARALDQLGEAEEAANVLKKSLDGNPEFAENWIELGQLQNQMQQFVEAESSLRTAVTLGMTNSTVIFALSNSLARQGKKEEAAKLREIHAELRTKDADPSGNRFQDAYSTALRVISVRAMLNASSMYLEAGDLKHAETIVLELLALDPQHVTAHMTLSTILRRNKRLPDALLVHQRLLKLEPDNPFNVINLASIMLELGMAEPAESELKKGAEKADPRSGLLHAELARFYIGSGRFDEAIAMAREAIQREPNKNYYALLATACKERGDSGGVFEALEGLRRLESQTKASPNVVRER